MINKKNSEKILITGAAGFIGFHLTKQLLKDGYKVIGYDAMTSYYEIKLKKDRIKILKKENDFIFVKNKLENKKYLNSVFLKYKPNYVVHLAAQAGVRHSIDHPDEYIDSNIIGTFNLLECIRHFKIKHFLAASTSSVYGSNTKMPFRETDKADTPLSIYAATKKATESICHSYSYNFDIPVTMFRFFTVYGPWGRPDMALFKFTKNILLGKKIEVYNNGQMYRDFTYVEDLVKSIKLLIKKPPNKNSKKVIKNDSISPVCSFRILNIGNSDEVYLMDFIHFLEKEIGKKAKIKLLPMQQGDVKRTYANTFLLKDIIGYRPKTKIQNGIRKFVVWYKEYYKIIN